MDEEIRREIERIRGENREDYLKACEDTRDLGKKLDNLFASWEQWGDSQDVKFEAYRADNSRIIEGTRGDIASALTGPMQRIEKQLDGIIANRERDLEGYYMMRAKQADLNKDITAAHGKVRGIEAKVDRLLEELPAMIGQAVKDALDSRETAGVKKTIAWIMGIIGAIIAEYIALRIVK